MIVRESHSPQKPNPPVNWPPKSPFDASQSSPSHKRRIDASRSRDSISPSPTKRLRLNTRANASQEEDEDDEETLQLKIKAIEAKLKLKRLRKAKELGVNSEKETSSRSHASHATGSAPLRSDIQVPSSPKKQTFAGIPGVDDNSPKRVQLGIDKGLKASDVSLKRHNGAASVKYTFESRHLARGGATATTTGRSVKSFSQRIAESRDQELERERKEQRRVEGQKRGFGLTSKSIENRHVNTTASLPDPPGKSFEKAGERPNQEDEERFSRFRLSKRKLADATLADALEGKQIFSIHRLLQTIVPPDYDTPDSEQDYVVFGIIASKSSPFDKADSHQTTTTADPDDANKKPNKNKFMYLRLTDLEYEIGVFLFDSAFDAFWKLTVGTVVAILNPGVMPPKPQMKDTSHFSLKLASSEDTVLEIGNSKDLFFCKSIKKDGKQCTQWLDRRKTEFCEFHINLKAEKAKAGRMEINGMVGFSLFAGPKGRNRGRGSTQGRSFRGGRARDDAETHGSYYDREARESAFAVRGHGRSAASMLDAEDYGPGSLDPAERSRLRMAAAQKERDLAAALGSKGNGMGSEYMRRRKHDAPELSKDGTAPTTTEDRLDAAAMNLMGGSADDVRLSPRKGSRLKGGADESGMGWAGAFKRGLLEPKQTARDSKQNEGHGKQARFALEKGIRLPGKQSKDSLADQSIKPRPVSSKSSTRRIDDDDDGLDII